MFDLSQFRRPLCIAAMAIGFLGSAHAGLVGTTVSVSLQSPLDFVSETDTVTVDGTIELASGDGSNVGNWLLPGVTASEFIDIADLSITLRLLGGFPGPPITTGFSAGAKYIFSGLTVAGFDIIGVTAAFAGDINNANSNWVSLDSASQISFAIDEIEFDQATSGTTFGDVTLTLVTRATGGGGGNVPEPGSLVLVGVALLSLWGASRRRGGFASGVAGA